MPVNTVTTNQAITSSFLNTNYRDQVVSTVTAAGKPAGTEGQMIAVTDADRIEMYSGAAWVRVGNYGTAGRTGVSISRAAALSIPTGTGTFTAITWDTEATDPDGFLAVPASTLTIPTGLGGLYSVLSNITWASSPGANSTIEFLNGATAYRFVSGAATQSTAAALTIGAIILAAGDVVSIRLSQGSGGAINVTATLQMWRLTA